MKAGEELIEISKDTSLEELEQSSSTSPSRPQLHRKGGLFSTGSSEIEPPDDGTRIYESLQNRLDLLVMAKIRDNSTLVAPAKLKGIVWLCLQEMSNKGRLNLTESELCAIGSGSEVVSRHLDLLPSIMLAIQTVACASRSLKLLLSCPSFGGLRIRYDIYSGYT